MRSRPALPAVQAPDLLPDTPTELTRRANRRADIPGDWKSKMATGTVKWFNSQKGYGFIQPSDGGKDVFMHISAVERAGLAGLNEGQKVRYEIARDRGKESAVNLVLAD